MQLFDFIYFKTNEELSSYESVGSDNQMHNTKDEMLKYQGISMSHYMNDNIEQLTDKGSEICQSNISTDKVCS